LGDNAKVLAVGGGQRHIVSSVGKVPARIIEELPADLRELTNVGIPPESRLDAIPATPGRSRDHRARKIVIWLFVVKSSDQKPIDCLGNFATDVVRVERLDDVSGAREPGVEGMFFG